MAHYQSRGAIPPKRHTQHRSLELGEGALETDDGTFAYSWCRGRRLDEVGAREVTEVLFHALCDDAAVFPPGNLPLHEAVPAHQRHAATPCAALVGSFVLAATDLGALAPLTAGLPEAALELSLVVPAPEAVADALAAAETVPAARLVGIETAVPNGVDPVSVVPLLRAALGAQSPAICVELPRDDRREALIGELAGTEFLAKLRTGGVRADLYPDEKELAAAVSALVAAGVSFKATAGLHHAVRNTDTETGFEQHGFLNLMVATQAAADGADEAEVARQLAERDLERLVHAVGELRPSVRERFRSFGTCSIAEPVEELVGLGLLPADHLTGVSR